jgi:hypothetical protein
LITSILEKHCTLPRKYPGQLQWRCTIPSEASTLLALVDDSLSLTQACATTHLVCPASLRQPMEKLTIISSRALAWYRVHTWQQNPVPFATHLATNHTDLVDWTIVRYDRLDYAILLYGGPACQRLNHLELMSPGQAACQQGLHQQRQHHAQALGLSHNSIHPFPSIHLACASYTHEMPLGAQPARSICRLCDM